MKATVYLICLEFLSYRNGDFDPSATLSKIEDSNIRVG